MVPCKSTAEEVSFEWSHCRILSTDSKVRTTLQLLLYTGSNRVYSTCLMGLESSLNSKAFSTHVTNVGLLSCMGPHVVSQPSWTSELLWTHITLVRLVTTVGELVLHQVKRLDTGKVTLVTFERLLTCNTKLVLL